MPNPVAPYNVPHFTLEPGESTDPGGAFLQLADTLTQILLPQTGGKVNAGPVEQLSGAWPEFVLDIVSGHPHSLTTQGGQALVSHPGGTRYIDLTQRLFGAVGPRTLDKATLYGRGIRLVEQMDRTLAYNRTLGAQVHLIWYGADPQWKPYRFGDLTVVGWEWMLITRLKYTMEAG